LWMVVLHKCRPLVPEMRGMNNCSSSSHFLVSSAWKLPEKMFRTKGAF
jgi:hypothetical protein